MMLAGQFPATELDQFLRCPKCLNKGIEILRELIAHLKPSRPENRLEDVRTLSFITMDVGESSAKYMQRLRALSHLFSGLNIKSLMPLFALMGINHTQFGGIVSIFAAGDPIIVNADLTTLETLLTAKVVRGRTVGFDGVPPNGSANQVGRNKKTTPAKNPTPASSLTPISST